MSRLNYSEDEEFAGQFALWQANVRRSLNGKRGQAALKHFRDALLALPHKRLIANALVEGLDEDIVAETLTFKREELDVCAIGAARLYQEAGPLLDFTILELYEATNENEDAVEYAPKSYPPLVAWELVSKNDFTYGAVTPEARYELMLGWVNSRILPD